MTARRVYLATALAAMVVYAGALANRFALDDVTIVLLNPVVRDWSGLWRAFGLSYWGSNLNTTVYRPLPVASYALDWGLGGAVWWFHAVNLAWHAGVTVLVAVLARRWAGETAALLAGLVFAVHPVHVEAVANVVGRNELMAAAFTLLCVYAALERGSWIWSAAAFAVGLFSKENAVVAPALILGAWITGVRPRPPGRRLLAFLCAWSVVGAGYGIARWAVFRGYPEGIVAIAPVFQGLSPLGVRLTAISGLADVARLLIFPLHLQADYSPLERTAATGFADPRFLAGMAALLAWGGLVALAWRARRQVEAFGILWVGIAYGPVANLVVPVGVFVAERLLYLPSAGLALAFGAWLRDLRGRALAGVVLGVVLLGGARTAFRVPAWRDDRAMAGHLLADAPASFWTYSFIGHQFQWEHRPEVALAAFVRSSRLYPRDARVYLAAADAAFTLGRPALADSFLARADSACAQCPTSWRNQAMAARLRGDSAVADSLLARLARRR